MDGNLAVVIIVIVFAVVLIVAFWRYRQNASGEIKGPFGTNLKIAGSNEQVIPPAIDAEGIKSAKGSVQVDDATGRGIRAKDIEAERNVSLSSKPESPDNDPKA